MVRDESCVDVGGEPASTVRPNRAWIRYRTEFRNHVTEELLASRETETLSGLETTDEAIDEPAFELVTTYYTRLLESGRPSETFTATVGKPEPPRLLTTPLVKPRYSMNIFSRTIANALQSVVAYYPSQPLTTDPIVVHWPYPVLVHHYDELSAFRNAAAAKSPQDQCAMERDADKHLSLLLQFLDEHVMDGVRAEQERNKLGFHTWEYLWLCYKPGRTYIELLDEGSWRATVHHSIRGGTFEYPPVQWTISGWSMEYNGKYLGRKLSQYDTEKFDGELKMNLHVLDIADINDDNMANLPKLAQERIEDGRQYWKLLQKQCKQHKGESRDFPYNEIEGLVMVDLKGYFQDMNVIQDGKSHASRPDLMCTDDCRPSFVDGTCAFCQDRKSAGRKGTQGVIALFEDYNFIVPEDDWEPENHIYLLCPVGIKAFAFKTRMWETVHVRNLSEPEFEEGMINGLVMDNAKKATLMSLAKSFGRRNKLGEEMPKGMWAADFVKGKGAGLIFLLHGRPGVGKTCTAECIAAFTRRPLMVITSSDIGTRPDIVETNLTRIFKTAVSWDAVLLIDEADVFMERRTTTDLTRNSLVAGFLRALEHYDGILFLTTNRVGAFDDAFISRIHVQLFYPEFTDEQRQLVWKTFMDKLARERGDYIRLNIDAKEYIRGAEMRSVQWNGREIRNALQTAVALAEYDAEKDEEGKIIITDAHLKAVVELSADFKTYLNELHRGDELKRAERKYERLDDRLRTPSRP